MFTTSENLKPTVQMRFRETFPPYFTITYKTVTTNCGPFIAYIFWRLFRVRSGCQKTGALKSGSDQHPVGIMPVPWYIILSGEASMSLETQ